MKAVFIGNETQIALYSKLFAQNGNECFKLCGVISTSPEATTKLAINLNIKAYLNLEDAIRDADVLFICRNGNHLAAFSDLMKYKKNDTVSCPMLWQTADKTPIPTSPKSRVFRSIISIHTALRNPPARLIKNAVAPRVINTKTDFAITINIVSRTLNFDAENITGMFESPSLLPGGIKYAVGKRLSTNDSTTAKAVIRAVNVILLIFSLLIHSPRHCVRQVSIVAINLN